MTKENGKINISVTALEKRRTSFFYCLTEGIMSKKF